jgi:hypothetical protein
LDGAARRALRPTGAWLSRDGGKVVPNRCPRNSYAFEAVYPQGLGWQADRAVRDLVSVLLADARETGGDMARSAELCRRPGPTVILFRGFPFRSSASPGALTSVLLVKESYTGGGAGTFRYHAMNLLPNGRELSLADFFPDPASSLPALWRLVHGGFCSDGADAAPRFYGTPPCAGPAPSPPEGWLPPSGATLDSLGHALVTSMGITLALDPDEAWGADGGPAWLDVPRDDLTATGADPQVWI